MVLANQRSSMPPRCVPRAYQSVGASLIRLPGCRKLRGTQVGVSRNKPPPASRARSRIARTLSFLTIFDAAMIVNCSPMNVGTRRLTNLPVALYSVDQPIKYKGGK